MLGARPSKRCFMNIHRRLALAAFGALLIPTALGYAPAYADGTPVRVRGSVVSLDGSKLVVRAKDGKDVSVSLADNFAALAVVKSSMADIKEGTFIGTATVTQPDTTLRSVEVVVFPDKLRGTAGKQGRHCARCHRVRASGTSVGWLFCTPVRFFSARRR